MNNDYIFERTFYLPAKNKVWGIILFNMDVDERCFTAIRYYNYYWTWWAVIGKKISISRHPYNTRVKYLLEQKKLDYGYNLIEEAQLLEMWPEIKNEIHNKIIFEVLSKHE